jgi:hypothetical protein
VKQNPSVRPFRVGIESQKIGGQSEKLTQSPWVSPTVLQSGPYRFFFFSSDRNELTPFT